MSKVIELERRYCAHNYQPLAVVLTKGEGVYLWDEQGNRYLDMMSAYSAVSHGHAHPQLVKILAEQASNLAIVSRAFYSHRLAPFLERVCQLTRQDMALPMNTGTEAVETALKAARKWAYTIKGVAPEQAEIIVCENNFHGRSIAIVGMSSEPQYREGFGPFPPGFRTIPYGDAKALEAATNGNSAAFLVEPIQGEGGIIVPPTGYLAQCKEICARNNVLMICDEIQTGLGRTGRFLACDHDDVIPDGLILGKALGGGLLPVSMFLAKREVMEVFQPGDHGSTFGGNPLASRVGLEAVNLIVNEGLAEHARELGAYMMQRLQQLDSPMITEVRGKGLLIGLEVDSERIKARTLCEELLKRGILTKETHETVVRLAPPLVITKAQVDAALATLGEVLTNL